MLTQQVSATQEKDKQLGIDAQENVKEVVKSWAA